MSSISIVLDASRYQPRVDFTVLAARGLGGLIHKATQGRSYVDPRYVARFALARTAGVLYGAYHFGTGDDPTAQAEHFLRTTANRTDGLLALDVELNPGGSDMTQAQAEIFVQIVQERTGRWPLLYGASNYLGKFKLDGSVLANCPLWWAQYTSRARPSRIPSVWPSYTLWQYTCEGTFPGISGPCDMNRFQGTQQELSTFWRSGNAL